MQQGSDEWLQARCGSIGSSDVPRIVRKTKTGYSADRESLMAEKVTERLTRAPFERYKTAAMVQGIEREPIARMTYSVVKGLELEEVGLIEHPHIKPSHASPDGLVGDTGLIEVKCPEVKAHLETLLTETISQDYIVQMHWQMACADRRWCDYVSYNPSFPPGMALWVRRVSRNAGLVAELEREVRAFIRELDDKVDRLARRYFMPAAA